MISILDRVKLSGRGLGGDATHRSSFVLTIVVGARVDGRIAEIQAVTGVATVSRRGPVIAVGATIVD